MLAMCPMALAGHSRDRRDNASHHNQNVRFPPNSSHTGTKLTSSILDIGIGHQKIRSLLQMLPHYYEVSTTSHMRLMLAPTGRTIGRRVRRNPPFLCFSSKAPNQPFRRSLFPILLDQRTEFVPGFSSPVFQIRSGRVDHNSNVSADAAS